MLVELIAPTLIAIAVMAMFTAIAPRFSTGAILTVASIPFGFFQIVGLGMGHCWPSETITCPTDDDVRRALWCIAVGVILANVAMWSFIATRRSRSG